MNHGRGLRACERQTTLGLSSLPCAISSKLQFYFAWDMFPAYAKYFLTQGKACTRLDFHQASPASWSVTTNGLFAFCSEKGSDSNKERNG